MSDKYPILALNRIRRDYKQGGETLSVLKGINLEIFPGEIVGLVGPSGSGKSSLLYIAGLLEKQNSGDVFVDGQYCTKLNDNERTKIRRFSIGFVYQYHHLLVINFPPFFLI